MDILFQFGQRLKELRARSGMSQEVLAFRTGLSRSYISSIESGLRNISITNMEKISNALNVTLAYLFSDHERFSTNLAYQQKDFEIPFANRFSYHIDPDKKVLSFQVDGLLTARDVDHMDSVLMGVCSAFGRGELSLLVDHRGMKASDGEPVVYSPEVAERAVLFQQNLLKYNKQAIVLCNSEFMVQQLNHVASNSGIQGIHLFGKDQDMICRAFELLDINGNELIKVKN